MEDTPMVCCGCRLGRQQELLNYWVYHPYGNMTSHHVHCSLAHSFWTAVMDNVNVAELWKFQIPLNISEKHSATFLFLCSWNIWKHWYDVIFRATAPSLRRLRASCKMDAQLWRFRRLPIEDRHIADSWCKCVTSFPICNLLTQLNQL